MHCFLDLPTEVLIEIVYECDEPHILAEVCKSFASIVYSMQELWCFVTIRPHHFTPEGPYFLRKRLARAGDKPIWVTIGVTIGNIGEYTVNVSALFRVLAEHRSHIFSFGLTAQTATVAGAIIHDVFTEREVFPWLMALSVLSMSESPERSIPMWPQLDLVLANAATMFPNLQRLFMNSFYDSEPMLPISASFAHLSGLVLEGSLEQDIPDPLLIVTLLQCMPQLESLWMKHHFGENYEDLTQPIADRTIKGRSGLALNVYLPRLKHLAVSVPGTACDLIACITAPALEDLHMDASRGPRFDGEWVLYTCSRWATESVEGAVSIIASRSPDLKRYAMMHVCMAEAGWEVLLFGSGKRGPKFPKLECIALYGLQKHEAVNGLWSGLSDKVLKRLAREPRIPLKKLVLLNCDFPLSTSAVVEAFRGSGAKEFVFDINVPQWGDDEWEEAECEKLGVSLTCLNTRGWEDRWWTYGHAIDVTDSAAYTGPV